MIELNLKSDIFIPFFLQKQKTTSEERTEETAAAAKHRERTRLKLIPWSNGVSQGQSSLESASIQKVCWFASTKTFRNKLFMSVQVNSVVPSHGNSKLKIQSSDSFSRFSE